MKLAILFFLLFSFLSCVLNKRLVEVSGTPFECGKKIGMELKESIVELYQSKLNEHSKHLDEWKNFAKKSIPMIKKYASEVYEEMEGMSSVEGLTMEMISMLNTDYEISMKYNFAEKTKLCSAFSSFHDGVLVAGQTNDENIESWFDGKKDVVININKEKIIYTHPGIMAYMGMNKEEIVLLWTYIDNEERNFDNFLPSNIILREILNKKSMKEVINFLQEIDIPLPNNFLISHPEEGIFNFEVSPTNFSLSYTPIGTKRTDVCHTNHIIFSQPMMDADVLLDPTSIPRFNKCREKTKQYRTQNGIDLSAGKDILDSPPIQRNETLASAVFLPSKKQLDIKFKGEKWNTYKLI